MADYVIDEQVEIGVLFGRVNASVIFGCVGAHVLIDGNVIYNGTLRPLLGDETPEELWKRVRAEARTAVQRAYQEIGAEFTAEDNRRLNEQFPIN